MLHYKGELAECVVYTDAIEETAVSQIYNILKCPAFEGQKIRIMPDVHAGAGSVIGFTSSMGDKVIPNVIGVDIGCGIMTCMVDDSKMTPEKLDAIIRKNIPSGFSVRTTSELPSSVALKLDDYTFGFMASLEKTCKKIGYDFDKAQRSIGTLGGGNHFIEMGRDEGGAAWLTVHTGSRGFGLAVAKYHQKIAKEKNPFGDLSYLDGYDAEDYYNDMKIAQTLAKMNRRAIVETICIAADMSRFVVIESVHNYIDFAHRIVRKGAISAKSGESVVIPWNMRDGLIIGKGKGNQDWNSSAPHGAGRVLGRNVAKKTLSMDEFKETMKDVWSSCVSQDTLDEAPMAYKNHEDVEKYLHETVDIIHRVKPFYNFKASGD